MHSFRLQDIASMRNVISRVKGSQPAPILLVANKLDLDCQREVSTAEDIGIVPKICFRYALPLRVCSRTCEISVARTEYNQQYFTTICDLLLFKGI
uniref:Uncharacterized protein n=1 Tax=Anopheles maculatus TaxID=74869 RepID=A0A182T927_9DIPT